MNKFKFLLSLTLSICLILSLPIFSVAADAVQLDDNVYITASCENNKITLKLTNNSEKNISAVGVFIEAYNTTGNIIDQPFELSSLSADTGETDITSYKLYSQQEASIIKIYPCLIIYDDWTRWGATSENYDSAVNLGYGFEIQNEVKQPIPAAEEDKNDFIIVGVALLFTLLIGIIIVSAISKFIKRISKGKSKGSKTNPPINVPTTPQKTQPSPEAIGFEGESKICNDILTNISGQKRIIKNAYITKNDGKTTEIDAIFIHSSGIYVIESKNYSGWIFGKEADNKWTQSIFNVATKKTEKYQFYNPILQNQNHVKYLKAYLGHSADTIPFYSVVIFGDKAELKDITITSQNSVAIKEYDLIKSINAYIAIAEASKKTIADDTIQSLFEKLYPLSQVSEETRQKHIEEIKKINE